MLLPNALLLGLPVLLLGGGQAGRLGNGPNGSGSRTRFGAGRRAKSLRCAGQELLYARKRSGRITRTS